jgi:hypothetical protein
MVKLGRFAELRCEYDELAESHQISSDVPAKRWTREA